ncbi:9192_t:CDS:2 [Cetraspora pellucida]|uniref:9192_t:CDS:1 n=1 Tax=Cetraspora pellucida TaxID=1433469 RepID=A0A9N9J3N1_9GLOM|nr:9192_t:CDS:2 [Cetraspora pellucida]
MIDFLKKAGMIVSIIELIPKSENNDALLSKAIRVYFSVVKAEEISDIANTNILNYEMAKSECYEYLSESLTEEFIAEYGNPNYMKWFRAFWKLYNAELLKTYTPVKDINDQDRYTADIVKLCLESSKSIKYLQDLVPKMAQVFDNTNTSHSIKKSALFATYRIKFKATNNKQTHYYLVDPFDKESVPKLLSYQIGEEQFYKNDEDICYGYSKLSSDELEITLSSDIQLRQELFDII